MKGNDTEGKSAAGEHEVTRERHRSLSTVVGSVEAGISRLGVLIFVLIIAAAVFVGYQVFPFYYYFYEIQGLLEAQAKKASVFTDAEMKQTILEKVKKLQIPLEDPDSLKINRFDNKIVIEFEYDEVLYIDLSTEDQERVYDLYTFHFVPRAEAPIAQKR